MRICLDAALERHKRQKEDEEGIAQRKLREEKLSHNRETAPAKKVAPRKVPVPQYLIRWSAALLERLKRSDHHYSSLGY